MALITTIVRGTEFRALQRSGINGARHYETRKRALVICDGFIGDDHQEPPNHLPPLEPDILGEYFVLSAFADGYDAKAIATFAWNLNPEEVSSFLVRVVQNFADEPTIDDLFHSIPNTQSAMRALTKVSNELISAFSRKKCSPTRAAMKQIERAHEEGLPETYQALGYCYLRGFGVEKNEVSGFNFLLAAAESDKLSAVPNLAYCYLTGKGTEKKSRQSNCLVKKSNSIRQSVCHDPPWTVLRVRCRGRERSQTGRRLVSQSSRGRPLEGHGPPWMALRVRDRGRERSRTGRILVS